MNAVGKHLLFPYVCEYRRTEGDGRRREATLGKGFDYFFPRKRKIASYARIIQIDTSALVHVFLLFFLPSQSEFL